MKRYIVVFITFLVALVVLKAPAFLLQDYISEYELSGKVVNGSAYNPTVGQVRFVFSPLKLLTGKLAYELSVTKDNNTIFTTVAIDLFGDIVISDTSGLVALSYIKQLNIADITPLKMVDADMKINDLFLIIKDKIDLIPSMLEGNFDVLEVNVLGEKIGSYNIIANVDNNINSLQAKSKQNALFDLDAQVRLVDKEIIITGTIKGKDDNSTQLLTNFGIGNTLDYQFKL